MKRNAMLVFVSIAAVFYWWIRDTVEGHDGAMQEQHACQAIRECRVASQSLEDA